MGTKFIVVPGRGKVKVEDSGNLFAGAILYEGNNKQTERRPTPYERTRAQVYATGNKWAIENFHATHD